MNKADRHPIDRMMHGQLWGMFCHLLVPPQNRSTARAMIRTTVVSHLAFCIKVALGSKLKSLRRLPSFRPCIRESLHRSGDGTSAHLCRAFRYQYTGVLRLGLNAGLRCPSELPFGRCSLTTQNPVSRRPISPSACICTDTFMIKKDLLHNI